MYNLRKPKAIFTVYRSRSRIYVLVHVHVHMIGVTPDIMEGRREIIAYLAHTGCTTREIQKLLVDVCGKSLRFAVH